VTPSASSNPAKLLVEGTLGQLRDRYAEHELEEIFVKVVAPLYAASEAH